MRSQRGYHSYRGRRNAGKVLLVILLALVLAAAVAYLYLQDHIVYESDGSIHVDLPFFKDGGAASDQTGEEGDVPPVEILPGDEEGGESEPLRAQVLSAAALCGAETDEMVAMGEKYTGVAVEAKGDNGFFYYTTEQARQGATAEEAVSQSRLEEALTEAEAAGLRTIARLSCFHDSFFAYSNMAGAGICQSSGYIWYDNHSSYWIDPSKEAARAYLYAVAEECVAMGFDELLLTEFTYPTAGNLGKIDYSGMTVTKEEALSAFLTELRETVGGETAISVELTEELILAGSDETAGLNLEQLIPLVDHIYVAAEEEQAVLAAVEAAGASEPEKLIVWEREDGYVSAAA